MNGNPYSQLGSTNVPIGEDYSLQNLLNLQVGLDFLTQGTDYEAALDPYDITEENLLRDVYREDYRDFSRQLQGERFKAVGEMGKAGFAGGGGASQKFDLYQAGLTEDLAELSRSMKTKRFDLQEDIEGLRSTAEEDMWSVFTQWQEYDPTALDPEETVNQEWITCLSQNPPQIYDPTSDSCVDAIV